jgi:hypothetical protein
MGREPALPSGHSFGFRVLGQHVRVECHDSALTQLMIANFGAMAVADMDSPPDLAYAVQGRGASSSFSLVRQGEAVLEGTGPSDFLCLLEQDITVELQRRRPGLFFLHSAAIEWKGKAYLLPAESGAGKSTTAWALLHHGFGYLSDELSPIDLSAMEVFPYPHALCLKRPPLSAYPLPEDAIHLGRTIHIPEHSLPNAVITEPRPLGAVFLVGYCPDLKLAKLNAIGPAEAGARLYPTVLNALAHPNQGLDAVVRLVEHVPCFTVSSSDLPATCALIRDAVEQTLVRGKEAAKTSHTVL